MDNFRIDVTAEGKNNLLLAIKLGLSGHGKVTHWVNHPKLGFVLFWANPQERPGNTVYLMREEVQVFPFPHNMDAENLLPIIIGYLAEADYGQEPDHDGSNGKGFRVFCERWGHVGDNHYACLAVQTAWAMYGK